MRVQVGIILWLCSHLISCSSSSQGPIAGGNPPAPPVISSTDAQNGAVIVKITPGQTGLPIHYTMDGSNPTASSQIYQAAFLVASNLTVKAIDILDLSTSRVSSQTFSANIPSGTLVWSDEFASNTGANPQPDSTVWTYDTGTNCCGNNELEDYCAWNSPVSPCDPASPNAYVGTDGYLHILGRSPATNSYTSGRLKSQGLFSFKYGRIEARMKLPEAQGMWPAFWMLGNNIALIQLACLRRTRHHGTH